MNVGVSGGSSFGVGTSVTETNASAAYSEVMLQPRDADVEWWETSGHGCKQYSLQTARINDTETYRIASNICLSDSLRRR